MQLLVAGGLVIEVPALLADHRLQLRMDVAPFAHAADVDEILAQQGFVLAVRQLVHCVMAAARIAQPFPKLQVADEFTLLVIELGMRLVGLRLLVHGTVAHVLHAERAGDHQDLVERLPVLGLQDHAADARVQRQLGQRPADRCEFVVVIHRTQFGQQLVAVGNGAALRRLDEGKAFNRSQVQRLHAQNHRRQRAAQNLGVGKAWPARKVGLVVQPYADAISHPAAAPGALVGGRLRDRLDHQLLDLVPETVALDARRACINHVSDARHGERCFSHVGRQHDAPAAVAVENPVLLGLAQAGKQRQDLGIARERLVRQVFAQVVGGFADFALAGQKNQDVARAVRTHPEFIDRIGHRVVQAVVARFLERTVALLDRKHPARHHDDRRRPFG